MTATISMPQKLNRQVNEIANCMGITNKKLFLFAIQKYVKEYNKKTPFDETYSNYTPDKKMLDVGVKNIRELLKDDTW